MGREIRRVSVDFDWPLDEVWPGFLMPDDADEDTWEPTDPPEGEGWQVWETVSEGSPITPVFATAAELVDYLASFGTTWDQTPTGLRPARGPWRREAAEQFVADGWAPSFVMTGGQLFDGARDVDVIRGLK